MKQIGWVAALVMGTTAGLAVPAMAQADGSEPEYAISSTDFPFDRSGDIVMHSFADVGLTTKLNQGEIVERKYWPGVLDTQNCTGALVGPNTILTAAHCVDAEDKKNPQRVRAATLNWFGTLMPLQCEMNPAYAAAPVRPRKLRNAHDQALCHIEGFGPTREMASGDILASHIYEVVTLDARSSMTGADIIMTGYGCYDVKPFQRLDDNGVDIYYDVDFNRNATYDRDRRLRIGMDRLEDPDGITLESRARGDLLEPSLCPGDSGGPVFSAPVMLPPGPTGPREILGVNSTITLVTYYPSQQPPGEYYRWPSHYEYWSNFAGLANATFVKFLEEWATRKNAKLCLSDYGGNADIVSNDPECPNVN